MSTGRRSEPSQRSRRSSGFSGVVAAALVSSILLAFGGCGRSDAPQGAAPRKAEPSGPPGSIRARPLAARESLPDGEPLFESLPPERTGIDFACRMDRSHPRSNLNHTAFVSGGAAMGDVTGDGRPDLFFTYGPGENRLYRQGDDLRFEDVTESAGVGGGDAWGVGAAMADIDSDGDLDIYVCNYGSPNQLFINRGDGRSFLEAAADRGLDLEDASLMPYFADYDLDGDLDVFVLTYRYYRPGGRPKEPPVGFKDGKPYILPEFEKYYFLREIGPNRFTADTCGRPDRFFRNDGGRFTDVGEQAGIRAPGHGLSAIWWDYDEDGLLDIYVANDFTDPDHLYRNRGDGTFTDVIASVTSIMTWSSMGSDLGDIDGDGRLDLLVGEMSPTTHRKEKMVMGEIGDRGWFLENNWPRQVMRNHLFLSTGAGRFMEVAFLCGLARSDWTWGPKLLDLDGDGRVDALIANGCARMSNDADVPVTVQMLVGQTEWDIWKDQPPLREQDLAFRNEGDLRFRNASREWGLDHVGMSYSSAHGDLDGDGDLDLVTIHLDERVGIYRNRESRNHRVIVALEAMATHRSAVGAVVRIETPDGAEQIRVVNPQTGYAASNDPALHFGLGAQDTIRRLSVTWPGGGVQRFEDLEADHRYTIVEPDAPPEERPAESTAPTRRSFEEIARAAGLAFVHRETPFDDYARQPLLPGKLSQLGGGMAWGDADGDGDDDLFLCGAAGQAGELYLRAAPGRFERSRAVEDVFRADERSEDMAALWLDADGDGDLDLLVTSGGVECEP
ncbi:MAG: CRTAC1 family protein, partial [Planctomycetes bacterium]|nr:CRTAC1 family protein [Planctomycetota bacterium]